MSLHFVTVLIFCLFTVACHLSLQPFLSVRYSVCFCLFWLLFSCYSNVFLDVSFGRTFLILFHTLFYL